MNILENFFSDGSAYAFVWTLFHSLWQCLLIAIILAIFLKFNPRHSAHSRYLMAISALVACVLTSIATYIHVFESISTAEALLLHGNTTAQLDESSNFYTQFYQLLNRNIDIIFMVWMLGFALHASAYLRDFLSARNLKTQGCENVPSCWLVRANQLAKKLEFNKHIEVKNSTQVSSICVIGHFKPVILLPIGMLMSLPEEQVEALLLHELAHVKRNDYLVKAIQNFVHLLYFFNPSVIWISKMIDFERENACDDVAVQHCQNAKLYATSLANISELELKLSSVLAARDSRYKLLPRVTRLFVSKTGSQSLERLSSLFCAVGMLFALNVNAAATNLATSANVSSNANTSVIVESDFVADERSASAEVVDETPPVQPEIEAPTVTLVTPPEIQSIEQITPSSKAVLAESKTLPTKQKIKATAATDRVMYLAAVQKQNLLEERDSNQLSNTQAPQVSQQPTKFVRTSMPEKKKAKEEPPLLHAIDTPEFGEVYVADSFSLPVERKIYIADIPLEFSKIWLQRFKEKTSKGYREYVQRSYAESLKVSLTEKLTKAGWQVVNKQDHNAITLFARIHNLYIAEPEVINIKTAIIAQAGQSGIEFIFADSHQTNFMKIVDYRNTEAAKASGFQASRATNQRYFNRLMKSWSADAISYLNSVSALAEQQVSASTPNAMAAKVPPKGRNTRV